MNVEEACELATRVSPCVACELATRVSPCVEIEYYFAVYFTIFASLHLKCCITELLHRAGFLVARRGGESTYPVLWPEHSSRVCEVKVVFTHAQPITSLWPRGLV